MSNLIHWPARLNELFDDAQFFAEHRGGGAMGAPLDIVETETGYELTADLPGLTSDDVHIEYKDGRLWISGERQEVVKEEGKTYHRSERRHGKFRRVIALPKDVASDKIEAAYNNGVLSVSVPKAETSMARKIEIK